MDRLFPFRSETSSEAEEPKLVDISDDAAEEVFAALSSATARTVYKALHEEPRTASDLADVTDTTVQNVRYHLDNLADAGLIEVVDTWYSERGREMKVYAPADTGLVVFAGDDDDRSNLRTVLRDLVGGLGLLALSAVLVQRLATGKGLIPIPRMGSGAPDGEDAGGAPTTTADGGAGTTTAETTRTATETVEQTSTAVRTTTESAPGAVEFLPPGALFFLVGALALLAILVWRHR